MPDVVEFLRAFRERSEQQCPSLEPPANAGSVFSMSATEFRDAKLAILVRSYLLGEDVLILSNESCKTLYEGDFVTYLPEELMAIYSLPADSIKRIHKMKKLFDGLIMTDFNQLPCGGLQA